MAILNMRRARKLSLYLAVFLSAVLFEVRLGT